MPALASVCVTACLFYHNIPDLSTPFPKVFQKNFPETGQDLRPGRDPNADQEQQGFRSHRFPRNKNRRGRTRRSAPTVYDCKFPPAHKSEAKHVREAKETVSTSRTRVPVPNARLNLRRRPARLRRCVRHCLRMFQLHKQRPREVVSMFRLVQSAI